MNSKEMALRQIDDIYAILHNNLKAVISGPLMIATGLAVLCIPLMELIFNQYLDPLFANAAASVAMAAPFLIRTIFYWTLFMGISKTFKRHKPNPLIAKLFAVGKFFPLIPLAVGASLGATGHSNLIMPMVMVLIGLLFLLFGQFTQTIVSLTASSLIVAGILGIWLTTLTIPHLWMYLLAFEGCAFIGMGLVLQHTQRQTASE